jgi:hypothetical protein
MFSQARVFKCDGLFFAAPELTPCLSDFEWVEILEPVSKRRIFVNIATGDSCYELADNVPL